MKNDPSIEQLIEVTINCVLIRMTEINIIDRSVLYQEFREWIENSGKKDIHYEILCLRYLKGDNKRNQKN